VVSAIEHPSTLDLYRQLAEEEGLDVAWVGAGEDGRAAVETAASLLGESTRIASLMHSNNETGVLQDLEPLASACRKRGVPLHVDLVQSLGKVVVDLSRLGADLAALSAHKVGGPPGIGLLYRRQGARFDAPHRGGPQERGLRPGTENVPAAAGFARAVELLEAPGPRLRDRLWAAIRERVPDALLNGDPGRLLPNTLNVSFPGVRADLLLIRLDLLGLHASAGSACASGALEPSHVLRAMGLPPERVESAVRLSLGYSSREDEVDRAAEVIGRAVGELRERGPAPRAPAASPRSGSGTPPIAPGTPRGPR
jgi:cysteine desulfurase